MLKPLLKTKTSSYLTLLALSFGLSIICGLVGAAFAHATLFVTSIRMSYPVILFLLPIGAVVVSFTYKKADFEKDGGVPLILKRIRGEDDVPLRMAPLIFFAATLSHFCGASVGRVGTSLQLGGSIGNTIGNKLGFSKDDTSIIMLAAMSGVFSGFFGTPLAGILLSIEVAGIKRYIKKAIIPCVIVSIGSRYISYLTGISNLHFSIIKIPEISPYCVLIVILTAALTGICALCYYKSLSFSKKYCAKLIKNPYLKGLIGGFILLGITVIWGMDYQPYNGIGAHMIQSALDGQIYDFSFLLKILFTALSIGIGYKGGEVYPAIFVGATFGSAFGNLLGFYPSFAAAIGIVAVFNGILKCPLTAVLLSLECFGHEGALFFIIAICISQFTSGRGGIFR